MIRSRFAMLTALVAVAAISTTATAQTTAPAKGSTTEQLLATVNAPTLMPIVAPAASATEAVDLISEGVPADRFGALPLHKSADDKNANADADGANGSQPSFLGSTIGRVSIVAIAAAASVGTYLALNGRHSSTPAAVGNQTAITPATGPAPIGSASVTPAFSANPEPATMALMVLGLGSLALVARRRRAN